MLTEYPVSWFQNRAVCLDRMARPAGAARVDNVLSGWRIRGEIDERRLHDAIEAVVYRHDALRTVFPGDIDPPLARVAPTGTGVEITRLRADAESEARIVAALAAQPFDIQRGPVCRVTHVRLAADHNLVVCCYDHVVADGVKSVSILGRELAAAYQGLPATPPALTYGDFAVRHRDRLTAEARSEILRYWAPRLPPDGPDPPLSLQPLRPGSERALGTGTVARVPVPPALAAVLPQLRARHRVTNFVLFLSAMLVAVRALSDRDEVGALYPVDVRAGYGAGDVVGRFSSLAVVWQPIRRCDRLGDLLDRVAAHVRGGMRYAALPFGEIIRSAFPDLYSDVDGPPYLFFGMRPVAAPASWAPGIEVTAESLTGVSDTQIHPGVKISVEMDGAPVALTCQYAIAAYSPEVISGVLRGILAVLEMLSASPTATVADLADLTAVAV